MAFLVLNLGDNLSNPRTLSAYVELLYDICSILPPAEAYGIFAQSCVVVLLICRSRNTLFPN